MLTRDAQSFQCRSSASAAYRGDVLLYAIEG
jgi:hypothetical protein